MKLRKFLQLYKESDLYLVDDLKPAMLKEMNLLPILKEGGVVDHLGEAVMWFSSGGTKSRLHNDNYEGLNCLFDGEKTFHLMDYNTTASVVQRYDNGWRVDRSNSIIDVTDVDLKKFPGFATTPHFECRVQAGDCIYVPSEMFHQVNSPPGMRNLAINVWWGRTKQFREGAVAASLNFADHKFRGAEDDEDDDEGPGPKASPYHDEL